MTTYVFTNQASRDTKIITNTSSILLYIFLGQAVIDIFT